LALKYLPTLQTDIIQLKSVLVTGSWICLGWILAKISAFNILANGLKLYDWATLGLCLWSIKMIQTFIIIDSFQKNSIPWL
jgi:hypothetical protein